MPGGSRLGSDSDRVLPGRVRSALVSSRGGSRTPRRFHPVKGAGLGHHAGHGSRRSGSGAPTRPRPKARERRRVGLERRAMIFQTEYIILIIALAFFALSISCDVFFSMKGAVILIEDGFKLFGIVTWFIFYTRTCLVKTHQLCEPNN